MTTRNPSRGAPRRGRPSSPGASLGNRPNSAHDRSRRAAPVGPSNSTSDAASLPSSRLDDLSADDVALEVAPVGFAEVGVPTPLVEALAASGITTTFPIQAVTLPDSLAGADVVGRGRTGSGKTVAFSLPVVATIARRRSPRQAKRPAGLVLVPTRELAAQVADTLRPLAESMRQTITVIHGGVSMGPQINALGRGVDIVVACPGRLEDLIRQGHCSLDRVEVTVLDEADHMADLGFLPVVRRLLDATPRDGQRLLFSATIDNGVDVLVQRYLHSPVVHSVDSAASPVPEMDHHVLMVSAGEKGAVVQALGSGAERTLLFMRTKHGARKLARQLTTNGIPAVDLHGNLSQNARTRNLDAFAAGEVTVLVATDIAARGIHVDEVSLVVHVDPPAEHKAYLHRSGRTARAGARGTVVTIMTADQRRDVDDLMRKARIQPTRTTVEASHPLLRSLAGEPVGRRSMPASLRGEPQPARATTPGGGSRRSGAGRPAARGAGGGGGQRSARPNGSSRQRRRSDGRTGPR